MGQQTEWSTVDGGQWTDSGRGRGGHRGPPMTKWQAAWNANGTVSKLGNANTQSTEMYR